MACIEFENLIPEYLDQQLPQEMQSRVAAHLAQCETCQQWVRQLEQLDAALLREVKAPVLPPDFRARLQRRIEAVPAWSEAERAERRRRLQAEYEAGLARLRPFSLSLRQVRKEISIAAGLSLMGWSGWWLIENWSYLLAQHTPSTFNTTQAGTWAAAAILLALGWTATAFRRQLRRVLLPM